jgi:hypothetical protein
MTPWTPLATRTGTAAIKACHDEGMLTMIHPILLASLAFLSLGAPVLAQESGGLGLDPAIGDGPRGLAQPLPYTAPPYFTARDLQVGMSAADRQAKNQSMITKLRGDPGYLAGFSFGTPLAASRQQVGGFPDDGGYGYRRRHGHGSGPIIINEGPTVLTFGDGNVVQQQNATSSSPIAQQQVSTKAAPGVSGGGATNLVTGAGNIIQRAPGSP